MSIHQCVRPFLIVLTNVDVFEQVQDPVLKQICVCVDVVVCFATNLFFLYVFYGQNECILGILLWRGGWEGQHAAMKPSGGQQKPGQPRLELRRPVWRRRTGDVPSGLDGANT